MLETNEIGTHVARKFAYHESGKFIDGEILIVVDAGHSGLPIGSRNLGSVHIGFQNARGSVKQFGYLIGKNVFPFPTEGVSRAVGGNGGRGARREGRP